VASVFARDVSTFWNLTTHFGDFDISVTPRGTQGYHDPGLVARQLRDKR